MGFLWVTTTMLSVKKSRLGRLIERVYLAVLRKDYVTHTIPVSFAHFVFLQEMWRGGTVGSALSAVSQQLSQDLAQVEKAWNEVSEIRDSWINAGFFLDRSRA